MNRFCRPWQRRCRCGSFVEQSHQPDKAFVTVCAMLNASTRIVVSGTNRAKPFGRGFTGYAYVTKTCGATEIEKRSLVKLAKKLTLLFLKIVRYAHEETTFVVSEDRSLCSRGNYLCCFWRSLAMLTRKEKEKICNNRINLIKPLSRFVQCWTRVRALLWAAQTAPSPAGAALQVMRMLARRFAQ